MSKQIADKLFLNPLPAISEIEARYPARSLAEGAKVTRIAPSPTGFMHVGTLYMAMVCERVSHMSGGVYLLRLEDTDGKREVAGAAELIIKALDWGKLTPDEEPTADGKDKGNYGPYIQSKRKEIYQTYIRDLVERDLAYPCFATPEELDEMRKTQEAQGVRPGYYGEFAKWRDAKDDEVLAFLDAGKPWVIRMKSPGDGGKNIKFTDLIKGDRELPENDLDIVIMKQDGLPTYHFAHFIDDHLMGVNCVLRADEWYSSIPLHLQLFKIMGWKAPKYGHLSPIEKVDGSSRRKLSKRKDPEASMQYYAEQGYLPESLLDYLMNIANSNFEDWRKVNAGKSYKDFPFSIKKLGTSGALFDFVKLDSIGREVISRLSAAELYDQWHAWAKEFDVSLAQKIEANQEYVTSILKIERDGAKNPRKDFAKLSDIYEKIAFFFDDDFKNDADFKTLAHAREIAASFANVYSERDSNEEWFTKLKEVAAKYNYATDMKEYKAEPEKFLGSIADAAKILRLAITGREQSPDLHAVMKVMGAERAVARLNAI